MNLPPNLFTDGSLQSVEPPKKTVSYGIDDLLEDCLDNETLHLITSDVKTRMHQNM